MTTERQVRIKIRGELTDLTDEQRAGLRAEAPDHDPLSATGSSFTREGHVTYEIDSWPFFTFRFADSAETDDELAVAADRAVSGARAWLDARGLTYRLREPQVEDLSQAPQGSRQRREQRRG